jgi:hypothetical protein
MAHRSSIPIPFEYAEYTACLAEGATARVKVS